MEDVGPYEHNFTNEEVSESERTRAREGRRSQLMLCYRKWIRSCSGISVYRCLCGGCSSPAVGCRSPSNFPPPPALTHRLAHAGMILGINRSRFHAPLQALGAILTLLPGNFLGHHHGGRSFHSTAHSGFAHYMWWYLVLQTGFGIFLKLHVMEGTKVRRGVVLAHGVVGKR